MATVRGRRSKNDGETSPHVGGVPAWQVIGDGELSDEALRALASLLIDAAESDEREVNLPGKNAVK